MRFATAVLFLLFTTQTLSQSHTSPIDVLEYRAELSFNIAEQTISAQTDVALRNTLHSSIDEFCLDLRDMKVSAVYMREAPIAYHQNDSILTITLPESLPSLDTVTVRIEYSGHPTSDFSGFGAGVCFGEHTVSAKPQSSTAWYVSMTCHWLPVNNIFSDRAIYDLTFDVPKGLVAASMGTLIEEEYGDERDRFRWRHRDPVHPQVVGWAVGPYYRYVDEVEGHRFECYSRKGFHINAKDYFEPIRDMIATFEHLWGPYPGEKIGFAITDSASIETHTMILLKEGSLHNQATGSLEAHELAHHWWGNCVTPMDLRENWLSEGFAMYGEIYFNAMQGDRGRFDEKMAYFANMYVKYIAPSEDYAPLYGYREKGARYNYSSVIYIKGATVLNMLRQQMGDSLYHEGLLEYFRRYRYKNVTSTMFRDVMQEFTAADLNQFFQQWVYERGWPIFDVREQEVAAGAPLMLSVRQLQSARGWCLFETPVDLEIITVTDDTLRVRTFIHPRNEDVLTINSVLAQDVVSWQFDPDGWLLKQMADPAIVQYPAASPNRFDITALYPQPLRSSADRLNLRFTSPFAAPISVRMYDMLGQQIRKADIGEQNTGSSSYSFDVTGVMPGHYIIHAQCGKEAVSRMIVVQ